VYVELLTACDAAILNGLVDTESDAIIRIMLLSIQSVAAQMAQSRAGMQMELRTELYHLSLLKHLTARSYSPNICFSEMAAKMIFCYRLDWAIPILIKRENSKVET
jgi:hypothetical protein